MGPVVVIPARSGSSRFPNKPLAELCGLSLIERTWRIATRARSVSRVIVATDSDAIARHVRAFGGEALISPQARNGCERAAWAAATLEDDPQVVVNLQGDAVLTPVAAVEAAIGGVLGLQGAPPCAAATVALPLSGESYETYLSLKAKGRASGTTVVCDLDGYALYFSKMTLPHLRHPPQPSAPQALRHVGLYAFTPQALAQYQTLTPTPLENIEGLEQLRWLEHGHRMRVVVMAALQRPIWSIDYPEDLQVAEKILQRFGDTL